MKYESPKLTVLTPAISAIQAHPKKVGTPVDAPPNLTEAISAYPDWED